MPFGSLWLPVVVATVVVFVLSALAHMALRYHRADFKRLPDEDGIAAAIRKAGVAPGNYFLPYCEFSQMKDPAFEKKFREGPLGIVTLMKPGPPNMAKSLTQWFVFCFLVSFTTGYLARHTLSPASDPMHVLQIAGTVAFVGYGYGVVQSSIFGGIPWSNTIRSLLDALVYGIATGFVFRFLWPAG